MCNKDYIVNVSKYEIKNYLKNATKDILDNLMLCDSDVKNLDGETVSILYKDGIVVLRNPAVLMDKSKGSIINKGTYREMRYAYEDIYNTYTKLSEGVEGDIATYLSFRDALVLVELPCNRTVVERVWSDNKYIGKLLDEIIDKRG